MKLRVGVVGLGDAWENRHRPALRALADRFEVSAVCAEVQSLAQRAAEDFDCLLYTSPSPRDRTRSRMPSSA